MTETTCPNCGQNQFKSQSQTINLPETLKRWEEEAHVKISVETKDEFKDSPQLRLYHCDSCEFTSFVPPISGTAHFYGDITKDDYYFSDKWEFKKVRELIAKNKLVSVLDVGCGQGAFLKSLKSVNPQLKIAGFDFNPTVPDFLKQNNIRFENDLNAINDTFDVVTAFQIIEHLNDPFSFIKKVSQFVKPNGYLVITVPNLSGPIRLFPKALTEIPPHHVTRWTPKAMEVFVQKAGFKVETSAAEPMAKIFWKMYIPAMIENSMGRLAYRVFEKLRGPRLVRAFLSVIERFPIQQLPLKGHSFLVVAKKCAE